MHMLIHQPQAMTRTEALCKLPTHGLNALDETIKTVRGLIAAPLNILSFGQSNTLRSWQKETRYSNGVLKCVYIGIVSVLNPSWGSKSEVSNTYNLKTAQGIFTSSITTRAQNSAKGCAKSSGFFTSHVASRSLFALSCLTAKITRVADFTLGILGLAFTFLTLGQSDTINTFTMKQIEPYGIINDFKEGICGVINPHAIY